MQPEFKKAPEAKFSRSAMTGNLVAEVRLSLEQYRRLCQALDVPEPAELEAMIEVERQP